MSRISLKDRLAQKAPELFEALYKEYRPIVDKNITILDLSYEALKVNVYRGSRLSKRELDAYTSIYKTLQTVVRESLSKRKYTSLNDPKLVDYFSEKNKQPYPVLIDSGADSFFIVGKNFDAIRNFVTKNISRDPRLKASRFGELIQYEDVLNKNNQPTGDVKVTTRSKVDIGHIPTADNPNLVSPLELKIQSILDVGNMYANSRLLGAAKKALEDLYEIQANISYDFNNTTPEAIETARSVLGNSYVVVTLHTQKKNNEFSLREKQIFDKLVAEAALSINIADIPGSNTINEDIAQGILNILATGKHNLAKHNTRKTKESATKKISASSNTSSKSNSTPPQVATAPGGSTYPIASLQTLINELLPKYMEKNMGKGDSKVLLNYRSGRLAGSAHVERMSVSREGMISAFYSYMRNPYGTFSVGGLQSQPPSRDPKLLISKSIREIAATKVANRMRAILV